MGMGNWMVAGIGDRVAGWGREGYVDLQEVPGHFHRGPAQCEGSRRQEEHEGSGTTKRN